MGCYYSCFASTGGTDAIGKSNNMEKLSLASWTENLGPMSAQGHQSIDQVVVELVVPGASFAFNAGSDDETMSLIYPNNGIGARKEFSRKFSTNTVYSSRHYLDSGSLFCQKFPRQVQAMNSFWRQFAATTNGRTAKRKKIAVNYLQKWHNRPLIETPLQKGFIATVGNFVCGYIHLFQH